MKCHRNMENAVSVGTFGEKKCASTMQFVPRHTEIRHRRNIENLSACYSTAGSKNPTRSVKHEIRKLRGMTLSEFSRKSGLSPHTARNLMGYRELYGNPRMDTMVDAARALNAVVTITPKGVTIRARKESA